MKKYLAKFYILISFTLVFSMISCNNIFQQIKTDDTKTENSIKDASPSQDNDLAYISLGGLVVGKQQARYSVPLPSNETLLSKLTNVNLECARTGDGTPVNISGDNWADFLSKFTSPGQTYPLQTGSYNFTLTATLQQLPSGSGVAFSASKTNINISSGTTETLSFTLAPTTQQTGGIQITWNISQGAANLDLVEFSLQKLPSGTPSTSSDDDISSGSAKFATSGLEPGEYELIAYFRAPEDDYDAPELPPLSTWKGNVRVAAGITTTATINWALETVYTITWNMDGGTIADATYVQPERYTRKSDTISLPTLTKTGYDFDGWYDNASFTGSEITSIPKNSTGNKTLYAKWTLATAEYTVNHYQQNVYDDEYTLVTADTQTLTGNIGASTAAAANNYPGFDTPAITQETIAADGTTVVNIYYDRQSFTLTYSAGSGISVPDGGSYRYGQTVTVIYTGIGGKEGFAFAGWTYNSQKYTLSGTTQTFEMPANNVTLEAEWGNICIAVAGVNYATAKDAGKALKTLTSDTDFEVVLYNATDSDLDWIKGEFGNMTATGKILLSVADGHTVTPETSKYGSLFGSLQNLKSVDLNNFVITEATSGDYLFNGCVDLEIINFGNFDISKITSGYQMFKGCSKLVTITVPSGFDMSHITTADSEMMFTGCTSLVGENGTTFDSTKVDVSYAHIDAAGNPGYFSRKPYPVGSIVLKDGSIIPYSESLVLTSTQKQNAIAVIIYDGKTGDTLGEKCLGVGLEMTKAKIAIEKDPNNSSISVKGFMTILASSDDDGKVFTQAIQNCDDYADHAQEYYPAVYWVSNYKNAVSNISGTSYENDWYIPSKNELKCIYDNVAIINSAFLKINESALVFDNTAGDSPTGYYWAAWQHQSYYTSVGYMKFWMPESSAFDSTEGKDFSKPFVTAIHEF